MGVGHGRTMTREMLAYRQHTAVLHTARESDTMACHNLGVRTIGAISQNRMITVNHIKHRSEIHMHPYPAALARHFSTIVIKQFVVTNGP